MIDVGKFIVMVKTFADSGLMTPSFAVSVYLPIFAVGPWREAVLKDLNPDANVQVVIHVYGDHPYLATPSLNSNMYDHEMIIFVNSKGDRSKFIFETKGEDEFRLGDPVRFWSQANDSFSPSGNPTMTGWWRMDGFTRRMNITQKPVLAARWILDHFCAENAGVVDVTLGTGTTALAAILTGRAFLGFDLCPDAVEAAKQRILRFSADWRSVLIHAEVLSVAPAERELAVKSLAVIMREEGDEEKDDLVEKFMARVKNRVEAFRTLRMAKFADLTDPLVQFYVKALSKFCIAQPVSWTRRMMSREDLDVWLLERGLLRVVNMAREANKLDLLEPGHEVEGEDWELEDSP
jgi:hypothetical protein